MSQSLLFFVRADSSNSIGFGHITRSLILAAHLRNLGHKVVFMSSDLEGNANALIKRAEFELFCLPVTNYTSESIESHQPYGSWIGRSETHDAELCWPALKAFGSPDVVILDNYSLGITWQQAFYDRGCNFVIDDINHRQFKFDVLLNQNFGAELIQYNSDCQNPTLLLGPEYALLSPHILINRAKCRTRSNRIKKILVSFGGVDMSNQTIKCVRALKKSNRFEKVTVLINSSHASFPEIQKIAEQNASIVVVAWTDNMDRLIDEADLCVGAGGVSLLERVYRKLPSAIVSVENNQTPSCLAASDRGYGYYLGFHNQTSEEKFLSFFETEIDQVEWSFISERCGKLGANKIIDRLGEISFA